MAKQNSILSELRQIERKHNGILRANDVVAYAENPATALHSRFEWDDTKAGYQYRLLQARNLIRVQVHIISEDIEPVRCYVSLKENRQNKGGGYLGMGMVLMDRKKRETLLQEAYQDMEVFIHKYERLKELAGVRREIAKIMSGLSTKKKKKVG